MFTGFNERRKIKKKQQQTVVPILCVELFFYFSLSLHVATAIGLLWVCHFAMFFSFEQSLLFPVTYTCGKRKHSAESKQWKQWNKCLKTFFYPKINFPFNINANDVILNMCFNYFEKVIIFWNFLKKIPYKMGRMQKKNSNVCTAISMTWF